MGLPIVGLRACEKETSEIRAIPYLKAMRPAAAGQGRASSARRSAKRSSYFALDDRASDRGVACFCSRAATDEVDCVVEDDAGGAKLRGVESALQFTANTQIVSRYTTAPAVARGRSTVHRPTDCRGSLTV